MKIISTVCCCLVWATALFASEEIITLTAYYPAPFGDYEHIRTNTLEVYNLITNPNPNDTTDFRPLYIYQSLRILNALPSPYDDRYPNAEHVPEYIDLDASNNRLRFYNGNSGLFFASSLTESYEQGLVFHADTTNANNNIVSIRNKGDIYLQPGFNASGAGIEGSDFDFYGEKTVRDTVSPYYKTDDGGVMIEGILYVDDIRSRNDERLFLVGPKSGSYYRSIVISDKIYLNPLSGSEVVISGDLRITGDLHVEGDSNIDGKIETSEIIVHVFETNVFRSTENDGVAFRFETANGRTMAKLQVPDYSHGGGAQTLGMIIAGEIEGKDGKTYL